MKMIKLKILLAGFFIFSSFGISHAVIILNDNLGNLYSLSSNPDNLYASYLGNPGVEAAFTDIAWNSSDSTLWGITFNNLYKLSNMNNASLIGELSEGGFNALTFDDSGILYAASNTSSQLYTINTSNGVTTGLPNSLHSFSLGDLDFDSKLSLYMSGIDNHLSGINSLTGQGYDIGETGITNLYGLAYQNSSTMYGFSGKKAYTIDLVSGAATYLDDIEGLVDNAVIWGATSTTRSANVPEPTAVLLISFGLFTIASANKKKKSNVA